MSGFRIGSRPKGLSYLMLIPAALAIGLFLFTGVTSFLIWKGGTAAGERIELVVSGSCLQQAKPIVEARMKAIGLGSPQSTIVDQKMRLTMQLPGRTPDEQQQIPKLLLQPGKLLVQAEKRVMATQQDLTDVSFKTDKEGMPYVELLFAKEKHQQLREHIDKKPQQNLQLIIDGKLVTKRPNSKKLIEEDMRLYPAGDYTRERMKDAVDISILLKNKPIACDLTIDSLTKTP